jgi:drug/metabolite transporter (DMT)-like permease
MAAEPSIAQADVSASGPGSAHPSRSREEANAVPLLRLLAAFAAVYLVWGSTYLAIRIGVASLPPLTFAGARFGVAGLLLLAYAAMRGAVGPGTRRDWITTVATALLMPVAANGLVTWSERWVPSNQTALIVATAAFWTAGLGVLGPRGVALQRGAVIGLALGFGGVALLVSDGWRHGAAPLPAYAALLLSPILWSVGTIVSRNRPPACSWIAQTGWQMLIGGVVLAVLAGAGGEWRQLRLQPQGLLALAYLIVFGSCIAYAAYFWLVPQVAPVQLGTAAYVNPAVAALLGWLILDERMTWRQWLGTAVILAGTVLVTLSSRDGRSRG